MRTVLAIDLGTTNARAFIYNDRNEILGSASRPINYSIKTANFIEQDPKEILNTQLFVIRKAIKNANLSISQIDVVGITNQRETFLLWDRASGEPLCNAISWQDKRTIQTTNKLKEEGFSDFVKKLSGLHLDPYFSASKLSWLFKNSKHLKKLAQKGKICFGTVDSWLIWNLSERAHHITDSTNASRTMLYDINELTWSSELLKFWDIPDKILPKVVPSSHECSYLKIDNENIPVTAIAGDQQAALFGQKCFLPGDTKCTYGTGCFILRNIGSATTHRSPRLITTVAIQTDKNTEYAVEASIFDGGSVIKWLKDKIGIITREDDIERLASSVESSNGLSFVPALNGLGAPHWIGNASGVIRGISHDTDKRHFARASLEGLAWLVHDVLAEMHDEKIPSSQELKVDGGASKNNLLMQIQSNFIQKSILRPSNFETTAQGIAWMAFLGAGIFESKKQIVQQSENMQTFHPEIALSKRNELLTQWKDTLETAKNSN